MNLMTIIYFLLILGVILIVHELGHLISAKYFGVYCREFSIGMGPLLYSKQGKETKWSLRLIPIGGYVMMAGDEDSALEAGLSEEEKELVIPKDRTLPGVAKWKQAIIMFAGSFMNILLAFIIFVIVAFSQGSGSVTNKIEQVLPASVAQEAGLQSGDVIVKAYEGSDVVEVNSGKDTTLLGSFIADHKDGFTLVVDRNGEIVEVALQPQFNEEDGRYMIGVQYATDTSLTGKFQQALTLFTTNATVIISSILNLFKGVGYENLGGPVGIFTVTANASAGGFVSILYLLGMLSINVGLFNLAPLPIFDGGRIVILGIEAILGRDLKESTKNKLMYIGLFLLLLLFVFATWNDISRILFK